MIISHYDINTYECRIKALSEQLRQFRSGEKYVQITELHKKEMDMMRNTVSKLSADLAKAHQEVINTRNRWFEVFEDIQKQHEREIRALNTKIKALEARALKGEMQRDEVLDRLKTQNERYAKLASEYEELEDKNKKYLAQINHDFENSSIPSSKAVARKKIQNGREKTGRRPGGQIGHPHHGRKKQTPTKTVMLPAPDDIIGNPDFVKTGKTISKQLVSISLSVNVTEYQADIYYNSKTNEYIHAEFPQGVIDEVNYDGSIKSFLYLLNNDCCTSIDKCSKFLYDLSEGKLKISKGMINKLSKTFSDKTEEERKEAFKNLMSSPVMHTDCTNANVNGGSAYVYVCADPTGNYALYSARPKKGHEGVKGTVTESYVGILVTDHEATFHKYGTAHQECLAHVQRYLKDSIQNESELTWNSLMKSLIQEMIHYRNQIPDGDELDESVVEVYEERYSKIIATAEKEYANFTPGPYTYRDGHNLYKRMSANKEDYLLFLHDIRVPATNNLSERMLRVYKRKQVQATVFRSFNSISCLCNGMSVLYLLRQKNDANLFKEVSQIFER